MARWPSASTASAVPSVQPSAMTMTSCGGRLWASALRTASSTVSRRSCVGMSTEIEAGIAGRGYDSRICAPADSPPSSSTGLEVTPEAPRDAQTVDAGGRTVAAAIDGVRHARLVLHADHRGSLAEVIDLTHPFWEQPIVYAYRFTIVPGRIKGWGMHKLQDDRYHCLAGSMRTVLYDGLVGSPTYQAFQVCCFTAATPRCCGSPPASGMPATTTATTR